MELVTYGGKEEDGKNKCIFLHAL